jgi:hypothetical protein
MKTYRSKQTIQAVQYLGDPIPGITCHGTEAERMKSGCDSSRCHLPHIHTKAVGGMTVLRVGDWIFEEDDGPFAMKHDAGFRAFWEVPEDASEPVVAPIPTPAATEKPAK